MKILVVDDSNAMRALIRRTLRGKRYDDAEIGEASDGKEALLAIQRTAPDLVLANWNMPEISGIELLERLQHDGVRVSFGFITSDESAENRARALAAGACFVIGKPFTRADLRRAVNEATGRIDPKRQESEPAAEEKRNSP
jgi:two-component system chemotaxis response regulator CheY